MKKAVVGVVGLLVVSVIAWHFLTRAEAKVYVIKPTPTPVPAPDFGVNLALEAVSITASDSVLPAVGALSLKDDSYLTEWVCPNAAGDWVEIDLGRACRVSQITVVHPSLWGIQIGDDVGSYTVSARPDPAQAWSELASVQNSADGGYNIIAINSGLETRYIRLGILQAARDGGSETRISEIQVWGEALAPFAAWPDKRPIEVDALSRLDSLDSLLGNYDYSAAYNESLRLVQDLNNSGLINESQTTANWAEFAWGKTMINLGIAQLETGDLDTAYETWNQAKHCRVAPFAAAAAVKRAHLMLPHARLAEAYDELAWALGMYPEDNWARVELITYYEWSGMRDKAQAMAHEILDRYPEKASLSHVAWAESKLAEMEGIINKPITPKEAEMYEILWQKYKDAPPEAGLVVQDVAFRAKLIIFQDFCLQKRYDDAISAGEILLTKFPDKKGGWSAAVHDELARAYEATCRYDEARQHLDALEEEFPDSDFARAAPDLRAHIDAAETHYNELIGR